MRHLLIGGNGALGTAVRQRLKDIGADFRYTSRHEDDLEALYLDLSNTWPERLPEADIVYLVAAVAKFAACEDDPRGTWKVNVDAPLSIVRRYPDAFIVFVSSDAVTFCGGTEYARQKAHVEAALALYPRAAVVRPIKTRPEDIPDLADSLVHVGLARRPGTYSFGPQR